MKKLLSTLLLMVFTVSLTEFLRWRHSVAYNRNYNECKQELIAAHNFQTNAQLYECTHEKSWDLKVLGTIMWAEGSVIPSSWFK